MGGYGVLLHLAGYVLGGLALFGSLATVAPVVIGLVAVACFVGGAVLMAAAEVRDHLRRLNTSVKAIAPTPPDAPVHPDPKLKP
jgi:hypothetical protein